MSASMPFSVWNMRFIHLVCRCILLHPNTDDPRSDHIH